MTSSNMADDDDVGIAASGGGEAGGQVQSMFSFGSGKVATISAKALGQSRRSLADDDDVGTVVTSHRRRSATAASGSRAFGRAFVDVAPEWAQEKMF